MMQDMKRQLFVAGFLIAVAGAAGSGVWAEGAQTGGAEGRGPQTDPKPRPDLVRAPYSQADIDFMSGMIPHHAQAVLIAGWAESHGARPDVLVLCQRMVVGQRDEIEFMRTWLRDRDQAVPDANATHHRMKMNGVEHVMLMPGMSLRSRTISAITPPSAGARARSRRRESRAGESGTAGRN